MAKLVSSIIAALLFAAICYLSIPGTAFAQTTTPSDCPNRVNKNDIKKFVKLCAVLSDIQSLIGMESKIANISNTNNQNVSFQAAVEVSKGVEKDMCNWMNAQVGGSLTVNGNCSVAEMNALCRRI